MLSGPTDGRNASRTSHRRQSRLEVVDFALDRLGALVCHRPDAEGPHLQRSHRLRRGLVLAPLARGRQALPLRHVAVELALRSLSTAVVRRRRAAPPAGPRIRPRRSGRNAVQPMRPCSPSLTTSMPQSACCFTISATALRTRARTPHGRKTGAWPAGHPTSCRRSFGRGRLPTCVVMMRSVLRCMPTLLLISEQSLSGRRQFNSPWTDTAFATVLESRAVTRRREHDQCLSAADNEVLCRVGPGTPMGKVFREYWIPADSL